MYMLKVFLLNLIKFDIAEFLKPRPLEIKEIPSKIFVFPTPLSPTKQFILGSNSYSLSKIFL